MSADPAMSTGEYFPSGNKKRNANLPGMGGVFNSANIDTYQYAHNNPARYTDPDGRVTFDEKTKKLVAEPGGSIPVDNRETRIKQTDKRMDPNGKSAACKYRAIQASVEEFTGKNLTIDDINAATKKLSSGDDPALGDNYWINDEVAIINDALERLGYDPSKYNVSYLKPGMDGYDKAAGNATQSLRGIKSYENPEKIGHWQVANGSGKFLWDPTNGPTRNEARKLLQLQYVIITRKEE